MDRHVIIHKRDMGIFCGKLDISGLEHQPTDDLDVWQQDLQYRVCQAYLKANGIKHYAFGNGESIRIDSHRMEVFEMLNPTVTKFIVDVGQYEIHEFIETLGELKLPPENYKIFNQYKNTFIAFEHKEDAIQFKLKLP